MWEVDPQIIAFLGLFTIFHSILILYIFDVSEFFQDEGHLLIVETIEIPSFLHSFKKIVKGEDGFSQEVVLAVNLRLFNDLLSFFLWFFMVWYFVRLLFMNWQCFGAVRMLKTNFTIGVICYELGLFGVGWVFEGEGGHLFQLDYYNKGVNILIE